jgi:hypothetical protein
MSDKPIKPNVFIPIEWPQKDKVVKKVLNKFYNHLPSFLVVTEDIDHEIIEPKQLPESNQSK